MKTIHATTVKAAFAFAALAATIAPTLAFASPAHSQTDPNERTATVRYSDLNLASESGQRMLERRLQQAAREVCGMDEIVTGTRLTSASARACYDQTLENITREVATRTGGNFQRG